MNLFERPITIGAINLQNIELFEINITVPYDKDSYHKYTNPIISFGKLQRKIDTQT